MSRVGPYESETLSQKQLEMIVGTEEAPIIRKCCGPLVLTEEQQQAMRQKHAALLADPDSFEKAKLFIRATCQQLKVGLPMSLQELKTIDEAAQALIFLQRLRQGNLGRPCNYDFNLTILSGAFAGQEQEYQCPRCGSRGTYREPSFEDD